jgi:hypothetical protein
VNPKITFGQSWGNKLNSNKKASLAYTIEAIVTGTYLQLARRQKSK